MTKKQSILTLVILVFLCSTIYADEIHLIDGRIIKAQTCWTENNKVYYQKYGATVSLPEGKVLKIIQSNDLVENSISSNSDKIIINSIGMEFVKIQPGTFMMGISGDLREVTLTKGFYMQTTEVTIGHWNEYCMGTRTYREGDPDHPITKVNWEKINRFIQELNEFEETNKYRLPTEAEWEYACRAGTTTRFSWGDMPNYKKGCDPIDCTKANYGVPRNASYNCYSDPCMGKNPGRPMKVKSFPPNNWGLYDMHGNVEEICQDYYYPYPKGPLIDPKGPKKYKSEGRVLRGGSFSSTSPFQIQSGRRSYGGGGIWGSKREGFRIVMDLE